MTEINPLQVLVLQGGGALGAYQAGAYEALAQAGCMPQWVAGISIGAINSAIIAGNPPERRVEKLRAFWTLVSSGLTTPPASNDDGMRKLFNETSAAIVASVGVPGFFVPRFPPAIMQPPGTPEAISVYSTAPLRETLLDLVDFDLLNSGAVRLSVGAVQVRTGNLKYFDTQTQVVGPEHIMASGALPPGFPPILIDGEPYWDGGLVSNTPLQYVFDEGGGRQDMTIYQVDLFNASGPEPQTLMDIEQRVKDIRYSSRTRLNTDVAKELQLARAALVRLEKMLPREIVEGSDWKALNDLGCDASVTIIHLIHRRAAYWTQSSDYEFSRTSTKEHWAAGRMDVFNSTQHPAWASRNDQHLGVKVLDLTREQFRAELAMSRTAEEVR